MKRVAMRINLVLVIVMLSGITSAAEPTDVTVPAVVNVKDGVYIEESTISYPITMEGQVSIKTPVGNITVTTWEKPEVVLTAVKKISKAYDEKEAREYLDKIKIKIEQKNASEIVVEAQHPKGNQKRHYFADFIVKVPSKCCLNLSSCTGDILCENVQGITHISTVNGDLKCSGPIPEGSFATVNGALSVSGFIGSITVSNTNGNIIVSGKDGKGIVHASTTNGDTKCDGSVKEGRFTSTNGDITLSGISDFIKVSTTNGDITVKLPVTDSFELDAKTFNGEIRNDFGIVSSNKKKVTAIVGQGGHQIVVSSTNGDVTIKAEKP